MNALRFCSESKLTTGKSVIAGMNTGVIMNRLPMEDDVNFSTMKILNRSLLGVISCFLLSAGLSKAAQQLDPLTKSVAVQAPHSGSADVSAMACTTPCQYLPADKSQ
jgi:hypothetical protein